MAQGDSGVDRNGKQTSSTESIQTCVSGKGIFHRAEAALTQLLGAYEYAQELQRSVWDFALELWALKQVGITHNELRWLVCNGLAEQAREISQDVGDHRAFERVGVVTFHSTSCFVLTRAGVSFVRGAAKSHRREPTNGDGIAALGAQIPEWDRDRRELRVGDVVVKRFKVPAPNQVVVLAAFQEENWPVRIDDPLPPRPELEPKRRLHDTINSLNRNQKNHQIRFLGDGSGLGVRWDLVRSSDAKRNLVSLNG